MKYWATEARDEKKAQKEAVNEASWVSIPKRISMGEANMAPPKKKSKAENRKKNQKIGKNLQKIK